MLYEFDAFSLDTKTFVLKQSNTEIRTEPLVFDLLCFLLAHANEVVSKEELINSVWKQRIVSDTTIAGAIKSARKALGDNGTLQKYIKTIRGRGFMFELSDNTSSVAPHEKPTFVKPTLLIIVHCDNSSEALVTQAKQLDRELKRVFKRVPLLLISTEKYRAETSTESLTPYQHNELEGCQYLLECQLSQNNDVSLNVQLIDTKAGVLLCSHTFSYPRQEESGLMQDMLLDIVGNYEPQIHKAVVQSIKNQQSDSNAEAKFFEASGLLALKGWNEASFLEAEEILRQCIELKPDFSHAHAYLSLLLAFGHRLGILKNKDGIKNETIQLTDYALDLDPHDPGTLGFCGCALADIGLTDRGLSVLNKSLSIDPQNPQALVARGAARLLKSEFKEALEDMETGILLSPLDSRLAVWRSILASSYLSMKKIEDAYKHAQLGCEDDPRNYMPRVVMAAIEFVSNNEDACMLALNDAKAAHPKLARSEIVSLLGKSLGSKISELLN